MHSISLARPDDWHLHLRDGEVLADTVNASAAHFERGIIMPNLTPPVTTTRLAEAYRDRILAALNPELQFEPLMTLYLTDNTSAAEIERAARSRFVFGCKLYPAGATTNSDSGVTGIHRIRKALKAMEATGMVLQVHGEVTTAETDIFDRESVFIDTVLAPLLNDYPALKIVFEHITTAEAANFVTRGPDNLAATITPQHLLFNRNHLLVGGIRPHYYCLPILKRSNHQQALLQAATQGNQRFFLGTDSAPHSAITKESACGCAGCFSAPHALSLYAEVFEQQQAMHQLEGFASLNGPRFYGLAPNRTTIKLVRDPWRVPESQTFGSQRVIPLAAGQQLNWRVIADSPQ